MIRTLSLATVIAVGLALPATAEEATVKSPTTTTDVKPAARGNLFTEDQARVHLARVGFTNISPLVQDSIGAWRGTAIRDGKTVTVAVDIKGNVSNN